jgi:non-ribosomal peptide synthase protein (TIGR01720 family)
LEFVGRIDNQVKVRGYRIELGEVERAVQEQAGVAQAAVVVKERAGGERQLIAYVEMAEGSSGDAIGRVRAGVKERLPEYMCPAQYVRMERLPRTASGKLDRRALPEPEVAGERGQEYVAPRNEVERRLLEIWEAVLGSQGIGVKDNFFEVGGDSIVGIQIVARARQAGLELTPKQLFQYQTIAELAEQAGSGTEVVEAEQGEVRGTGPLTPIQRWFIAQHGVKARHYNQAFLFRVKAETKLEWLEEAFEKLVEQHDSLRMRVEQKEGEWVQSYAGTAESGVSVKRVDLSGSEGAEQEEQLREVVRREQESLDIEQGPVAGIVLVELGEEKGRRLLMVVHHMAVDGVSWRIMLEDVANWYGQRERGEQITCGRKTTSFKQWAEKLQEYGKSEKAKAERTYWAGEEARAVEELAVDYEGGENRFGDEGRVVEVLEAETTRELLSEAGKAYNTQVMDLLLGALVEGLWEWGGYERVRVELEGHGREDVVKGVDLTRTVGWFTSMYPVVLERRVGESVGVRIQRVKEQLRGVPEKGIGYGVLRYGGSGTQQQAVEKRKGEGELLINYLGQFDRSLGEEALLQGAPEGSGAPVGAEQQRSAKVEMNALVIGGQLQMAWSYSRQQYKPETITQLAQNYLLTLRDVIRHCTSSDARAFSANDFSEFKWESEQFGAIATAISQAG